jgi:hypothetical protein
MQDMTSQTLLHPTFPVAPLPAAEPAMDLERYLSLYGAWTEAFLDTEDALMNWHRRGGGDAFAVYQAAAEREDIAQRALASAASVIAGL